MRIAFYCPMKPISHPRPSGDREIARGLHAFLSLHHQVFILSEFRSHRQEKQLPWLSFALLWLQELWRAYRLARREKPDLFFVYHLYYKAPDSIALLLAWWFRKPYFVFEGSYNPRKGKERAWRLGFWLSHLSFLKAQKVFSLLKKDHQCLEERFPGKSLMLAPSLDLELFRPDHSRKEEIRKEWGLSQQQVVIVSVAMLRADRKGESVSFLVDCLAELAQRGLSFFWLHVGTGPREQELRQKAESLLPGRFRFLAGEDSAVVRNALQAGDFFAYPGLDEGFGLVFVEAQAMGLPVVAFRDGGIPEAVEEGASAILTPPLDKKAYTAALASLVLQPDARAHMARQARKLAETRFDREKTYREILREIGREQARFYP